jgi:hypothetical protein
VSGWGFYDVFLKLLWFLMFLRFCKKIYWFESMLWDCVRSCGILELFGRRSVFQGRL